MLHRLSLRPWGLLPVILVLQGCPGQTTGSDATPPSDATGTDTGTDATLPPSDSGATDGGPGTDSAPPPCTLTDTGPVTVTADGEVIEYLRITASGGPAITVSGYSDVIIRNVEILHDGDNGIELSNATNLLIEDVSITHTGAPASGALPSENNNISGYDSTGVRINRVRLSRGSSGIYLDLCPGAHLSFVEGTDFRGPFPRGQLVQFNNCDNALLEDFSVINPAATSWVEDNVSVFQSTDCIVRRGLIDGNNSPSGVGVMFELSGGGDTGGLVEDVDAIRMGNGCFSGYPGFDVVFRNTRCRENICTDQGRGAPLSGGLAWAGSPASGNLIIETSHYWDLCAGLVWDMSVFTSVELTETDFSLRAPIALGFCWEP